MQTPKTQRRALLSAAAVITSVILGASPAMAQSPPAAETTFNAAVDNDWTNASNWTNGIVTPTALGASTDSGFVANSTIINVTSTNLSTATNYQSATPHFGTLTLGTNSTLNITAPGNSQFGYYTASPYASPTPQAVAGTLWFNDGALAQFTSGSLNSNLNLAVVAGATGTFRPGSGGMVRGALTGASTSTLNVTFGGNFEWRSTGTNLAGNLNLSSDGATSRTVTLSNLSGTNVFGTGTATLNDNVRLVANKANVLSSASTLKVVGDSGATNTVKVAMNTDQTVGNFIVESPGTNLTGTRSLMTTGNATTARALTVSGTTTFQGTANSVEIDNLMTTPTGNSLVTKNLTFGGTGTWAVQGDGKINLSGGVGGSTITANVNASIANALTGADGFTKAGNGKLTLTGNSALTGTILVSAGSLVIDGAVASTAITVNNSLGGSGTMANATIGGSGSINPGNSPGIMTAAATDPTGGLDYNFEFGATGTVPIYSNALASGNDVLRLTSATPFTAGLAASNVVSLYFGVTSLTSGDVFTGGFFTDNDVDFLASITNATFQYFLSDAGGATIYNGANYTQYTGPLGITASTVAVPVADFAGGTVDGYVSVFSVAVPEPHTALLGAIGLIALRRRRR